MPHSCSNELTTESLTPSLVTTGGFSFLLAAWLNDTGWASHAPRNLALSASTCGPLLDCCQGHDFKCKEARQYGRWTGMRQTPDPCHT